MLARSWVFVADVAACPERVVDLRVFARMVRYSRVNRRRFNQSDGHIQSLDRK